VTGKRIREQRRKVGLLQCELARIVGVSRAAVCRWESGMTMPRAGRLPAVARALRCRVADLYA